jgi:hypothetical protein
MTMTKVRKVMKDGEGDTQSKISHADFHNRPTSGNPASQPTSEQYPVPRTHRLVPTPQPPFILGMSLSCSSYSFLGGELPVTSL